MCCSWEPSVAEGQLVTFLSEGIIHMARIREQQYCYSRELGLLCKFHPGEKTKKHKKSDEKQQKEKNTEI
uniref:Uncharacterized protein n=1 Tax=Romanomermis culicivorax TaxID=13658 RepID=A0A915KUW2_ROMCU